MKRRGSKAISSYQNRTHSYFLTRHASFVINAIILTNHSNPFCDSLCALQGARVGGLIREEMSREKKREGLIKWQETRVVGDGVEFGVLNTIVRKKVRKYRS